MLFLILLAILPLTLALGPTTSRYYRKGCAAKIEDLPWQVTDFVTFEKEPAANSSSYITFNVADINDRLELNTTCTQIFLPNSTASLDDETRYLCDSKAVAFQYDGETLELSRYYEDDCLGPVPYNSAIAYGQVRVNATRTAAVDGVYGTKSELDVPISSLS